MREKEILTNQCVEEILFSPNAYGKYRVMSFGRSLAGRPLYAVAIGQGSPRILCVAGHHAMEWICGWLLLDFLEAYHREEAENSAPRGTFYMIPQLNPDGVELVKNGVRETDILAPRQLRANGCSRDFSHWQANGRGVDLNHNYPAGFEAYRRVEAELGLFEGAPSKYSGVSPLSEPETGALAGLIELFLPDLTLALHTQGEEIFWGNRPTRPLFTLATLAARRLAYRLSRPTGTAAYGGLTDWLVSRGMLALTLECGRGVNPLPLDAYPAMAQKLIPFLFSLPRMLEYVNNL